MLGCCVRSYISFSEFVESAQAEALWDGVSDHYRPVALPPSPQKPQPATVGTDGKSVVDQEVSHQSLREMSQFQQMMGMPAQNTQKGTVNDIDFVNDTSRRQ